MQPSGACDQISEENADFDELYAILSPEVNYTLSLSTLLFCRCFSLKPSLSVSIFLTCVTQVLKLILVPEGFFLGIF